MQVLMIITLCMFVLYSAFLNLEQQCALTRAHSALAQGQVASAMASLDEARRTWPQFYPTRTRALCGDITLARARHLMDDPAPPDFLGAAGLVRNLASQCGTTDREAETIHMLAHIATRHLAHATLLCGQGHYVEALRAFDTMDLLVSPQHEQDARRLAATRCTLQYAQALTEEGHLLAALDRYVQVLHGPESEARRVAGTQLPVVLERAMLTLVEQGQPVHAFTRLRQHRPILDQLDPRMVHRLRHQLEARAFGGLSLAQLCSGKVLYLPHGPFTPDENPLDPLAAVQTELEVQNRTRYRMQVILRGPQQQDAFVLPPQATVRVAVAPAEYLVGVIFPGQCQVMPPQLTSWTVEPLTQHRIQLASADAPEGEQPQGHKDSRASKRSAGPEGPRTAKATRR